MKKAFSLLVIISLFTSLIYAQLNTGSYFISGTTNLKLDYGTSKNVSVDGDKEKSTSFNITPKAGYFLKNRFAVGGLIYYDYQGTKYEGPDANTQQSEREWLVGPFGRYYLEYGKIIPFAEISAAFGGQKSISEFVGAGPSETTYSLSKISGGVGANYFMNEHIALEGTIQYFYQRHKPTTEGATGDPYSEMGLSVNFGIAVYFGKI